MSISRAIMVPHPPIILPNIGKGEEKKIAEIDQAYREAANAIVEAKPESVVIISPHIPAYRDYIQIVPASGLIEGNMGQFRDYEDRFAIELDKELIDEINEILEEEGVRAGSAGQKLRMLDHGTMIPLYYLKDLPQETKFVLVGVGGLSNIEHARVGQAIKKAAEKLGKNVAVVASGDLSHCQKEDSSYGFKPCGPEYDREIMEIMDKGDFDALLAIPEEKASEAMVCGQQPFCVLAGALDESDFHSRALAHSAEFGVGYGVAIFDEIQADESNKLIERAEKKKIEELQKKWAKEDLYVQLARETIYASLQGKKLVLEEEGIPEEMKEPAGVFVSLHENGELRGCIGTILPTTENIAQEIVRNAIEAAYHDPRFYPLQPWEFEELDISVDVLTRPEKIESKAQLDPKKYGVIVTNKGRRGLLLPDLEGVDTVEQQIAISKQKAGIDPDEEVELERFEVIRHH